MKLHKYLFTCTLLFVCRTYSMHKLIRSIRCTQTITPIRAHHSICTQRLPISATKRLIATKSSSARSEVFSSSAKKNLPDYRATIISAISSGNVFQLSKVCTNKPTALFEEYDGIMPLHFAATCRIHNIGAIIEVILGAGAPIDEQTKTGDTALHLATQNNNKPAIKTLLANDADIHIKNKAGKTALEGTDLQVNDLLDE